MPKQSISGEKRRKPRAKANGEGTVYWEEDRKKWRGEWHPTGASKPLKCRFDKKGDVDKQIAKWKTEFAQGTLTMPSKDTVGDLLSMWLTQAVPVNCKASTQNKYRIMVETHLRPRIGSVPLSKLTPPIIQRAYHDARQDGASDFTLNGMHRVLHRCLQYAVENYIIARNPATHVEHPNEPEKEAKVLTVEQGKAVLEAAQEERFFALWLITLYSGLRPGEFLGVRWQDIDFEQGILTIRQTVTEIRGKLDIDTPKSKAGHRIIPLPKAIMDAFQKRRAAQLKERIAAGPAWKEQDLIFTTGRGTPYSPTHLRRRDWKRIMIRAELTTRVEYRAKNNRRIVKHTPICTPYALRHTAITVIGEVTKDIAVTQKLAGHSRPNMTMRYTHVFKDRLRQAMENVDGVWQEPKKEEKRRGI